MQIREVVIAGGRQSGKSSAESYLQRKLQGRGWRVLIVPDALELLAGAGGEDLPSLQKNPQYETLLISVMQTQHALRKQWLNVAKSLEATGERIVLLHRRTPLEYVSHTDDYEKLLVRSNLTIKDVRDGYDLILIFTNGEKDLEQDKLMKIWTGAPHVRIVQVGKEDDFTQKLKKSWIAAKRILAEAGHEIEYKFLLEKFPTREELLSMGAVEIEIEQTYLENKRKDTEERVRKRLVGPQVTYYHTTKERINNLERTEREKIITLREYNKLLMRRDLSKGVIHKKRYCLVHENTYLELDLFKNPASLALLEVEVAYVGEEITLPSGWKIKKDVTDDPQWTNSAIATSLGERK